mgnify:CR=1 FL=1
MELVNKILEQYIESVRSYQQDDWILLVAEFVYNSTIHLYIAAITPYFTTYWFCLRFNINNLGSYVKWVHKNVSVEPSDIEDKHKYQVGCWFVAMASLKLGTKFSSWAISLYLAHETN